MTEESQNADPSASEAGIDEYQLEEESKPQSGELTITLHRWHLYALVMPLIFVIGLGFGYLLRGWAPMPGTPTAAAESASSSEAAVAVPQADADASSASQQVVRYDVPVDDDPILGADDAPITIVEFSDYECPYCRQWHSEV